jgi:ribonuclease HI
VTRDPVTIAADASHDSGTGLAGWGAVIRYRGHCWEVGGGFFCARTEEAELHSIMEALKAVPAGHPANVFNDAQGVVLKWAEPLRERGVTLRWSQTWRHADLKRADKLSKLHMRQMRGRWILSAKQLMAGA